MMDETADLVLERLRSIRSRIVDPRTAVDGHAARIEVETHVGESQDRRSRVVRLETPRP